MKFSVLSLSLIPAARTSGIRICDSTDGGMFRGNAEPSQGQIEGISKGGLFTAMNLPNLYSFLKILRIWAIIFQGDRISNIFRLFLLFRRIAKSAECLIAPSLVSVTVLGWSTMSPKIPVGILK